MVTKSNFVRNIRPTTDNDIARADKFNVCLPTYNAGLINNLGIKDLDESATRQAMRKASANNIVEHAQPVIEGFCGFDDMVSDKSIEYTNIANQNVIVLLLADGKKMLAKGRVVGLDGLALIIEADNGKMYTIPTQKDCWLFVE